MVQIISNKVLCWILVGINNLLWTKSVIWLVLLFLSNPITKSNNKKTN